MMTTSDVSIVPSLFFYLFAAVAVVAAFMVITVRNTVNGVLCLVLTFFASAAVWLLLDTEFLALILVLVYVGAVMTLFLFVVMMLNLRQENRAERLTRYWLVGATVMLVLTVLAIIGLKHGSTDLLSSTQTNSLLAVENSSQVSNTAALGSVLYTLYVWPFEIAAVLLLAAIVAAIALAHGKKEPYSQSQRRQDPAAQMAVRKEDRIRIMRNVS